MKTINVSYFKSHLSAELEYVAEGNPLVITDHRHPVARVLPYGEQSSGEVRRPLRAFDFGTPAPLVAGGSLAALLEDRGRR